MLLMLILGPLCVGFPRAWDFLQHPRVLVALSRVVWGGEATTVTVDRDRASFAELRSSGDSMR